jgi:ABC-type cobalamin/Fe3+-siderophores transport system ATPase subunit
MLTVQNLVFEYPGARDLQSLSFTVHSESITALVGLNGAGKTTLLRCIAALDEPLSVVICVLAKLRRSFISQCCGCRNRGAFRPATCFQTMASAVQRLIRVLALGNE